MIQESMRILVVEDEPSLQQALVDLLTGDGHEVEAVGDGQEALAVGSEHPFDLVLLDLMLPRMNGLDVCKKLREARPSLPILVLTARGSEEDKVEGLRLGADDYVTKPFGARELVARVRALHRRATSAGQSPETLEFEDCRFDLGRCVFVQGDRTVGLTNREVAIVRWLYNHRARAVSRSELLQEVWGVPGDLQTRTVDMTISNLRHKIERDPSDPRFVKTVKGVGYAWGEQE